MAVIDDPTATVWHGQTLAGSYTIDREGVPAKPVQLVEKGVLRDYLRTRQLIHGYNDSNGRAQLSNGMLGHTACISNLLVKVGQGVPVAELRRRLVDTCKERDKAYGIVIRRMDYPSAGTVEEATKMVQSGIGGGALPVSLPVRIFKLYADGHEEQVRGLMSRGLNAKSPSNPATVVAPSLLIDDLDLKPLEGDLPKLPLTPSPAVARR
jgi:hypothetical protein